MKAKQKRSAVRVQLTQKGEQSRAIIESTRAQANSIGRGGKSKNETVPYRTAIQLRDAAATSAEVDLDNLIHELRFSLERVSFMSAETQGSSSHFLDLHDLVVQENARPNVTDL